MTRPLILAHRGWSSRAPENSLEAFALAAAGTADGVELDVHETADGGFVVHHDPDLPDGSLISTLPQFAITGRTGTRAGVPLLSEVLSLLAERMVGGEVFVEVKNMRSWSGLKSTLRPYTESLALEVQSGDRSLLGLMASAPEAHTLGLIAAEPGPDPLATLCGFGARTLSLHHESVSEAICRQLHRVGLRVAAWTVNDPGRARELAHCGVDVLIGDDPQLIAAALKDPALN